MSPLNDRINRAIRKLETLPAFIKWCVKEHVTEGDVVVINNSFVFRDASTTDKSRFYLAVTVDAAGHLTVPAHIAESQTKQTLDFRRIPKNKADTALQVQSLSDATIEQRKSLGHMVFGLIGTVVDDRVAEAYFQHSKLFDKVRWDLTNPGVTVNKDCITIDSINDEAATWTLLAAACQNEGITLPDEFKQEFAESLDKLQGLATASLRLPSLVSRTRSGIMDSILKALREHFSEYKAALDKYRRARGGGNRRVHFNEVLRVAYAFANEACTLLRLVVSVCDLKPLVLWATIDRHVELSEAIRSLPWTRSKHKPSLKNYVDLVGDARNRVFHNVFPFEKSLHFELPAGALDGAELRIFSEYGSKTNGNELNFNDKDLAEVMMGFTRARRRPTPDTFWENNVAVMSSMIDLFTDTNSTLKDLYYGL